MFKNSDYFIKKTLGEDFVESLMKSEIYKPGTRTVVDTSDIHLGLKLVPRIIMSLLVRELVPMAIGETKEVQIPVPKQTMMRVTKMERDSLNGEIIQENKKIAEFLHRSIPGIGLVLMSTLELYEIENISKPSELDHEEKIQKLIDEKLRLHNLINDVVEKKLAERDAIHYMLLDKLTEALKEKEKIQHEIDLTSKIQEETAPMSDQYMRGIKNGLEVANSIANHKEPKFVEDPKKGSPLKSFLEKREQKKSKKNEFKIQMIKGEKFYCDTCGKEIFNETAYHGCICMGENQNSKIYLKKTENGIKIRFGKGWTIENIEMLLEILRNKNE